MYKSIYYDKSREFLHLWDDEAGYICKKFKNFGFVKSEFGKYRTLHGERVDKIYNFQYESPNVYESDLPVETKALIEFYRDVDEPAKNIKVLIIDIETDSSGGFPNMKTFDKELTAFSYYERLTDQYKCLILDKDNRLRPYQKDNVEVLAYNTEETLLEGILNVFEQIRPDIVTGWNVCYNGDGNGFDIPYIHGRICRVLGREASRRLSEIGVCYTKKHDNSVVIAGLNCVDYLLLYKKFRFEPRQNYRLGYIGQLEVGMDKIKYEGSLNKLYRDDINKFIEYNLCDVMIVKKLDDQFKFLDLAVGVTSIGHVPYEWFHMSSRFIEGAIITYMRRNGNYVAPNKPVRHNSEEAEFEVLQRYEEAVLDNTEETEDTSEEAGFTGAYVKNPVPGLYSWVFSADINSLYPSTIRMLNISSETYLGRISNWNPEDFVRGKLSTVTLGGETYTLEDFKKFITEEKINVSSIGALYKADKPGVIPIILDLWFSQRLEFQDLVKKFAKEGNKEQEAYYTRRQHVQKIFLNCFSPDTQVLTPTGSKYITDFKVGDLVYSPSRTTGETEIKPVTRVYAYDYEGDMAHFKTQYCDFLVTPNHRFWVKKTDEFQWFLAEEIMNCPDLFEFPKITPDSPPGISLGSDDRQWIKYSGKVYCVEVADNHTLLCGRNDKFQWCGQSVYGVTGLPTSRFYLKDNAESTTLTGQTIIKTSEKIVIEYFKETLAKYGKSVEDASRIVTYIDTDSLYVPVDSLANIEGIKEEDKKEYTKKVCAEIVDRINSMYPIICKRMFNSDNNKIKIAPDTINATAFWKKKKAYALNQVYDMGKGKDVNKIKVIGLSSVRSDFPIKFKVFYEQFLKDILYRAGAEKISDSVLNLKAILKDCSVYELAKNTGVKFISEKKGMDFNPKSRRPFQTAAGATAQCKASLYYNDLLNHFGLTTQVEPIYSGQKIKYVYLKENEFGLDALAFKGDGTDPQEIINFIDTHCDKHRMYDAVLENKILDFFQILKWRMPSHETKTVEELFDVDIPIENCEYMEKRKKTPLLLGSASEELFEGLPAVKTKAGKIKEKKTVVQVNRTNLF
jgi:DNA polymerase elongation subunit (family B)